MKRSREAGCCESLPAHPYASPPTSQAAPTLHWALHAPPPSWLLFMLFLLPGTWLGFPTFSSLDVTSSSNPSLMPQAVLSQPPILVSLTPYMLAPRLLRSGFMPLQCTQFPPSLGIFPLLPSPRQCSFFLAYDKGHFLRGHPRLPPHTGLGVPVISSLNPLTISLTTAIIFPYYS